MYEIKDISLLLVRELNEVSGRVWIAQQPAYFLKAEGEIEGVFEFQNRHYDGNAAFTYEMKDFDQVEIQLPTLCAYPPEEMIPLPPNATEIQNNPPRINFSSPDSVDQVKSFYLKELDSQGWEMLEVPPNEFEEVIQASITTQQGIQILLEVKIHNMVDYSKINIHWQAQ